MHTNSSVYLYLYQPSLNTHQFRPVLFLILALAFSYPAVYVFDFSILFWNSFGAGLAVKAEVVVEVAATDARRGGTGRTEEGRCRPALAAARTGLYASI